MLQQGTSRALAFSAASVLEVMRVLYPETTGSGPRYRYQKRHSVYCYYSSGCCSSQASDHPGYLCFLSYLLLRGDLALARLGPRLILESGGREHGMLEATRPDPNGLSVGSDQGTFRSRTAIDVPPNSHRGS